MSHKIRWTSVIALCLVLSFVALTGAQTQPPVSDDPASGAVAADYDQTGMWFVELSSPPTADGTSLATTQAEKAAFRTTAASAGLNYQERRSFDSLFNGVAIRLANPTDVGKLAELDGVKAIYPVTKITAPDPEPQPGPAPELVTALKMTGADIVQNTFGLTGAGVKVGVIDTGIDYDHPDLGLCFGPGCRVAYGYDFVGDAFSGPATTPVPDDDPDDCQGHGTHVAGIVGANGAIKGVAPGVTFGAYRVFGCTGSTTDDVMIAAMERALADGMDIINMSIGSSRAWPEWPTAQAASRLVKKGMVVVASAGNDGGIGLYASSAPATGKDVISVAAFDNTNQNLAVFTVSPDNAAVGYVTASGAPPAPLSGTSPLARTGTPASANDACNGATAPAIGSLTGKVALIRRGTCSFYEKSFNAQNAGAIGVIIYNNTTGIVNPTVAGTPSITIPVVSIGSADGALIDSRIASDAPTMTWTTGVVSIPNPTGGLISSFSSYGVTPELTLKPDIGAPGGLIRSTFPVELGSYANLSGTSMSSPHVAGAAALLLQSDPKIKAKDVRDILQNTANPALWSGNPAIGLLDIVHRQGAGMLRIDHAILAASTIKPGKLELGESQFGPVTRTLVIQNQTRNAVTYNVSHVSAVITGPNTFSLSFFDAPATVTFSSSTVTVPARAKASVDVAIAANAALPDRSLYGGYIVFTPTAQTGGETLRVPYTGFKGDYQSIQVLVPTASNFPWLAKATTTPTGLSFANQPAGATYTFVNADIPYFLVHFEHQTRRTRIEIIDVIKGKSWHRAVNEQYDPRSSSATSFFFFPWDGTTTSGKKTFTVPNGRYIAVLSVLKALGDEDNPADWETWTSPEITIARP